MKDMREERGGADEGGDWWMRSGRREKKRLRMIEMERRDKGKLKKDGDRPRGEGEAEVLREIARVNHLRRLSCSSLSIAGLRSHMLGQRLKTKPESIRRCCNITVCIKIKFSYNNVICDIPVVTRPKTKQIASLFESRPGSNQSNRACMLRNYDSLNFPREA